MMMKMQSLQKPTSFLSILLFLTGGSAISADPLFVDRAQHLTVEHSYTGGWSHFVGGGVALFDCNNDGLTDLFAAGGSSAATLLVNTSTPGGAITFAQGDIGTILDTTGAYPIDVDSDTHADLMVLRNGTNMLLRGDGSCRFTDTTAALNMPDDARWSTAFSATWEAGRSLPTLAIGNYVNAADPNGPFGTCDTNLLLRPDGDSYGAPVPLDPGYCPLSMLFSDWQRSGTPMLRISNDRQYYVRDGYEQMWTLGPLRELTTADGWDKLQIWGMGIASQDITGDGLPDVMLTSMGDQMLMANTGDGFATVPFTTGTFAQRPHTGGDGRPSTGWHAEFGDVNNDGLPDLFIAKGNVDQMPDMAMQDPNNLLMQQPDGTFTEMAARAGVATTERARGGGLADLNNDGLLDLVVVNRRAPLEIWQNVTPDTGNWAAVDLMQAGANTDAIGAIITLRTDLGTQTREVTIGGGHVSGSLIPHHFGLGQATTAEVQITWPDGTQNDWQPIAANQITQITKP